MLAKVLAATLVGLQSERVEVEVDLAEGLPSFVIVGLPDTAVQEARERVRAALRNSGFVFPLKRITVNLAPADVAKEGTAFDVPIAIGILVASGQLEAQGFEQSLFLGELALDGSLRHTNGVLPMVARAPDWGVMSAYVPAANGREAAIIERLRVFPAENLGQLVQHLRGTEPLQPARPPDLLPLPTAAYPVDLADIKGQEHAKRALEVACSGGHNVLFSGPPGAGKSLLAQAVPSILPSLSLDEALEVSKIYSICGLLPPETPLILQRPFRAPHHTVSHAGLVGGGRFPRPGEISLAHCGVLFLDELPEFPSHILDMLRQPMETGVVTISRASGSLTFPAKFLLIGAMNPCPCGWYGDPVHRCTCGPSTVTRYQRRISGPLLDRIDIHVEVPRVEYAKLTDERRGEPSEVVRERVQQVRQVQRERFADLPLRTNAEMGARHIRTFCVLKPEAQVLMKSAMDQLHLTARSFHRVLKLARTIADLDGKETIGVPHVAEALQYRPRTTVA
jgi:magnesium chelatase family protein